MITNPFRRIRAIDISDWLFWLSLLVYFCIFILTGHFLTRTFLYGKLDAAGYLNALWLFVNGQEPWTWAYHGYHVNVYFGNHFIPIVYLYAPLYKLLYGLPFFDFTNFTIALEGLSYSVSAIPLFFMAKRIIQNGYFAYFMTLIYLWFLMPAPLHFYFTVLVVPYFAFGIYAWQKKQYPWAFALFLLALMVKEYLGITLAVVGLLWVFYDKHWKIGWILFAFSICWLFFAFWIMRKFQPQAPQVDYLGLLNRISIKNFEFAVVSGNAVLLKIFSFDNVKRWTDMFFSLGGLPFLGWPLLLPALPIIVINALLTHPEEWAVRDHHTIIILPFVASAAVLGWNKFKSWNFPRPFIWLKHVFWVMICGCMLIFFVKGVHFRLHYLKYSFLSWQAYAPHSRDVRAVKNRIPENASVATVESLEPTFSFRPQIIHLINLDKQLADFVVLDTFYECDSYYQNLCLLPVIYPSFIKKDSLKHRQIAGIRRKYEKIFHEQPIANRPVFMKFLPNLYKFEYSIGSLSVFSRLKDSEVLQGAVEKQVDAGNISESF